MTQKIETSDVGIPDTSSKKSPEIPKSLPKNVLKS